MSAGSQSCRPGGLTRGIACAREGGEVFLRERRLGRPFAESGREPLAALFSFYRSNGMRRLSPRLVVVGLFLLALTLNAAMIAGWIALLARAVRW